MAVIFLLEKDTLQLCPKKYSFRRPHTVCAAFPSQAPNYVTKPYLFYQITH